MVKYFEDKGLIVCPIREKLSTLTYIYFYEVSE